MTNLAIFVSGSGTNCENIIRYFAHSDKVRVALVVSNKAEALALEKARRHGVPTAVVSRQQLNDSSHLLPLLDRYRIDFIVLAGFLLMIPPYLIRAFDRRMVNIHPSLLPKFGGKGMYGMHVHQAVKAAGESETGITIHYVSQECDGGEIIARFATPLSPDDTPDDIARKVHDLEIAHFPQVIDSIAG